MNRVSGQDRVVEIAEAVGQRIMEVEFRFVDGYAIDDDEHIPRLKRISEAIIKFVSDKGVSPEAQSALEERLFSYAQDLYLQRWMSHIYDDEDPEEERDKAVQARVEWGERLGLLIPSGSGVHSVQEIRTQEKRECPDPGLRLTGRVTAPAPTAGRLRATLAGRNGQEEGERS